MSAIALTLSTLFAALGFGWRSWVQHRRTGSTGFRGISGQLGSVEWLAGVGFVVALIGAVLAPALQLAGAVAPLGFLVGPWIQLPGIVIAVAGIAVMVWAQLDMGDSWRIGVNDGETTTLVASIEVQVRLVEEPYLLRVHGEAYRDYVATVGRFVPGVGLGRG